MEATLKSKKCKSLFIGRFNLNRLSYVERCYAYSQKQAHFILCRRLAKKERVEPGMIYNLFDGSEDNFRVELEIEFEEVDS